MVIENKSKSAFRASRIRSSFVARIFTQIRRVLGHFVFSSLTRRILFLNMAGLGVLVTGILYLNQFRDGLIDARVESLRTQGKIIAGAIAASASAERDFILVDPEKLLEIQAGETIGPTLDNLDFLDFPINPERVAPVLQRLISPTRTRARIYDRDANILLDSRNLHSGRQIFRYALDPIDKPEKTYWDQITALWSQFLTRSDLPLDDEVPGGSGAAYSEVVGALTGADEQVVRVSKEGKMIVSVAVPIQRFRTILGVLQLSTQGGDIDQIVAAERKAILSVFGVAAFVSIILSMLLASTIATPLRKLSAAAVRVRRGTNVREEIPDFSDRQDEIGNLSIALRDMTSALFARIDAIEHFAADVAHELKNPLTSLRSAVETLPLAKTEDSKKRLLDVIAHDVLRLDRLITDISDASRLDAELARSDSSSLDIAKLLRDLVSLTKEILPSDINLELIIEGDEKTKFVIQGHDLRLGQVISNLIENAKSFVIADHGHIRITLKRKKRDVFIFVDDNGPGIPPDNIDAIFERFYTDRPDGEAFGQNSGLGLSISRQIIEAHGGKLTVQNLANEPSSDLGGARFIINLPIEKID